MSYFEIGTFFFLLSAHLNFLVQITITHLVNIIYILHIVYIKKINHFLLVNYSGYKCSQNHIYYTSTYLFANYITICIFYINRN